MVPAVSSFYSASMSVVWERGAKEKAEQGHDNHKSRKLNRRADQSKLKAEP